MVQKHVFGVLIGVKTLFAQNHLLHYQTCFRPFAAKKLFNLLSVPRERCGTARTLVEHLPGTCSSKRARWRRLYGVLKILELFDTAQRWLFWLALNEMLGMW